MRSRPSRLARYSRRVRVSQAAAFVHKGRNSRGAPLEGFAQGQAIGVIEENIGAREHESVPDIGQGLVHLGIELARGREGKGDPGKETIILHPISIVPPLGETSDAAGAGRP
jgi:hypothetical protein